MPQLLQFLNSLFATSILMKRKIKCPKLIFSNSLEKRINEYKIKTILMAIRRQTNKQMAISCHKKNLGNTLRKKFPNRY